MRNEPKRFFTTYDVARFTGTDANTVLKWVHRGLLPVSRTPGGHRRIAADHVRNFLAGLNMPLPPELGGPGGGVRVLLVDADAKFAATAAAGLRTARPRWEVSTETSGVAALLGLAGAAPVVLAIDLDLADVDALAAIRAAVSRAPLAPRLVVALAARATRSAMRKALEAGARTVIQKPVSGVALARQLEAALENDFAGAPAGA